MKETPVTIAEPLHKVKQEVISPAFFQKFTPGDKAADLGYVDAYGSFIWSLARKSKNSEAKAAVREIFIDIWRFRERRMPRTND